MYLSWCHAIVPEARYSKTTIVQKNAPLDSKAVCLTAHYPEKRTPIDLTLHSVMASPLYGAESANLPSLTPNDIPPP